MSLSEKDINTIDASWQLYDAERMANERLRQQLAEKDSEIHRLQMALADTEALELGTAERLAASQAREHQLREALETYADEWDRHWKQGMPILQPLSDKALTQPTDTSALEAVVQKAGEVMRERCLSEIDPKYYTHDLLKEVVECCCGDLRALPGVTLEDLRK